ncbi:MAG: glutamine--fructose-6-phosphate transaminase (isomerizing) [Pseudomonadota bacterium]|nr:glutamine--fructose-6-phosphate transaminase (isomerizing) [Pseudomonadota bacterium]
MCGIFGSTSSKFDFHKFIIQGIESLEYRGYDSAGTAHIDDNNQIVTQFTTKSIQHLHSSYHAKKLCAIAHTRWATHGKATIENAHPHTSHNRIAIVHNGIIENHKEIKSQLNAEHNITWHSETDSEVIAHALYVQLMQGQTIQNALATITSTLKGSYALAVLDTHNPGKIFITCLESPILVGKSRYGHHVASDAIALEPICSAIYRIPPKTIWTISEDAISSTEDHPVTWKTITQRSNLSQEHAFKHKTLEEIHAQPTVLKNLFQQHIPLLPNTIKKPHSLLMIACGSSYYCAYIAKYWMEKTLNIPVSVELASEFRYRSPYVDPQTLLITLSQSGETLDTLSALRHAKKQAPNIQTLSIGNNPLSTIAQESDLFWPTNAGTEIGVATTKVFTAQLACLQTLIAIFKKASPLKNLEETSKILHDIIQDQSPVIASLAKDLSVQNTLFFLGRGANYGVAQEATLKVQELAYLPCHAFAAGELKHGPLALIDHKATCIVLLSDDHYLSKLLSNIHEIQARHGRIVIIGSAHAVESVQAEASNIQSVKLPNNLCEGSQVFAQIICTQLLAYYIAEKRGCAIDKPRNLAKCVTVE